MRTELARDAAGPADFPTDDLPEVAIAGRSNVGKSTLINALVGRRSLARTSARPGKTRRVHFYSLDSAAYLVDLPGYGYAAVSKQERRDWQPLVESYLRRERRPLRGAILLIDLRRGPESEERDLWEWLAAQGIEARIALTKADKLKPAPRARQVDALVRDMGVRREHVAAVSARTGRGLAPIGRWLQAWTGLELRRPDGTPLLEL